MPTRYYAAIAPLLTRLIETQRDAIEQAADLIYPSLTADGVLHLFCSGHSSLVALEGFHRAGGLVPVNAIVAPFLSPLVSPLLSGRLERVPGVAQALLDYFDVRRDETLLVVSHSGINAAAIDRALGARERGARVVALVARAHGEAVPSRHPTGTRLADLADVVIDTGGPPGDALVAFDGWAGRAGPASLVAGAVVLHSLTCLLVSRFLRDGREPPVYQSANVPGGDEHNRRLEAAYRHRITLL